MHIPTVGAQRAPTHVETPIPAAGEVAAHMLFPKFLRKRFAPHRHQVAEEEVDRELLIVDEKDARGASLITSLTATKGTEAEKEETRNRLDELATFAMVGFGFLAVSVGTGAYNRERKEAVIRQSATDRDSLRGDGIRAPFGNRICQFMASLSWGTLDDLQSTGDVLLLSDCYPATQTAPDSFSITGTKMEPTMKQPATMGSFPRCVRHHVAIWCVGFALEHRDERMASVETLEKRRESHPELFTIKMIVAPWEVMTFRYVTEMKEGTRKMARMLPRDSAEGEFRRKALTPIPGGRTRWEYPAVFITTHPTGFWQSIAIPRLEDKVSRGACQAFLGDAPKRDREGGMDEIDPLAELPRHITEYPAGKPLTESERNACRSHRPKRMEDGLFLRWDFSPHGGCRSAYGQRPRGTHEIIKTGGLSPLIHMQLRRRGDTSHGRRSTPRIRTGM